MASDLDSLLRKALEGSDALLGDTYIKDIKQAFIDAGYSHWSEWYDRFEKELGKLGVKHNVRSLNPNMVLKAAKKAAGLTHREEGLSKAEVQS